MADSKLDNTGEDAEKHPSKVDNIENEVIIDKKEEAVTEHLEY